MGSKISRRRLVGSAVLAIAIIAFAYLSVLPDNVSRVTASNADELLKNLASKDSDADGLLDWEEALYGTDPQNPHSVDEILTDAEAVTEGKVSLVAPKPTEQISEGLEEEIPVPDPAEGSFTEHFADLLFTEYTTKIDGRDASDFEKQQLVTSIVESFTENTEQFFVSRYTFTSLNVQPELSPSSYVQTVERLFTQEGTGLGSIDPLDLVTAVAELNDQAAKDQLVQFARFYSSLAAELAKTAVPSTLADSHLSLIQSFDRFAIALATVGRIDEDPLVTLAVLPMFESEPSKAMDAVRSIVETFTRTNGTPQKGQVGYVLRSLTLPPDSL